MGLQRGECVVSVPPTRAQMRRRNDLVAETALDLLFKCRLDIGRKLKSLQLRSLTSQVDI
jgi:hypothetical protein